METETKKKFDLKRILNFNVLAIILIVIFCIAISPVTLQNDTYYTIKIGEHITNYGLDMKDPFSWHENLDYTYPHWLYDILTYKIYSIGGFTAIYAVTTILACILGIIIYFTNCKLSKNKIVAFLVTIGSMYLLEGFIAARAQLVTFIIFIIEILLIEKFLQKKRIGYALGLIILPILIANLHCAVWPFYFVLFLPYIAEYIIAVLADTIIYKKLVRFRLKNDIKKLSRKPGKEDIVKSLTEKLNKLDEKVEKIKKVREEDKKNPYKIYINRNDNVKYLIIIMIICAFTGLLTPLGDTPYTYLIKTMQGNTTKNISEHLPMTLTSQVPVLSTIIIFLGILTFTKTKIKLSDLFMLGGLCYLMLSSRRQLSLFALICAPILTKLAINTIYEYDYYEKISGWFKKRIVSIIGILLLIALVGGLSYKYAKNKPNQSIVDESTYPVQACDYILNNIDLKTAKFYNEYNYGSYMLFRGIPVFIDSRADLYAPEFSGLKDDIFSDFLNISGIGEFYEDVFEKYGITHVICYRNSKLNLIIIKTHDSNYKEIYVDNNFIIYERLSAKNVEENKEILETKEVKKLNSIQEEENK
ncbi:MAG: hypothetical protein IJH39_01925 [Clostridia bacterium]|nr:hypothetical protein [Clostridia bacterium]